MQDHDHDHALARPELQRFVAAARAQTIAGTCVTAESVQAGLEDARRRSHAQRMLWLSGTVAVAASLVVMIVVAPLWSDSERPAAGGVASKQLDHAVHMSSTGTSEIRDAWSVALGEGTHEVELVREHGHSNRLGDKPLRIELPGRTLELVEGRVTIEVVGDDAAIRLHTGVAAWIGSDGQRTEIEVEHIELETTDEVGEQAPASATTLAREADRLLAADERQQAIDTLRRLIETYPHASQARTAVLDLARLLAATERESEARCAYELYLARWPDSSVTAEVEAQLAQLAKADCRGLDLE
jgi:hypothetical protein